MSTKKWCLLGASIMCAAIVTAAGASEHAYVVSYVEAVPAAKDKAAAMLRAYARASRKDAGNVRVETLQRVGHPGQFAIVEVWDDEAARKAHAEAGHTKAFHEKLQPLLRAPYDERPHTGLSVGDVSAGKAPGKGAAYAVTHVDIVPKLKDEGVAAVKQLAETSRGDKGNLRFDALTQASRPNHMTLVEVWSGPQAGEAHGSAEHTKSFRATLMPMSGSLFDERHYRALD